MSVFQRPQGSWTTTFWQDGYITCLPGTTRTPSNRLAVRSAFRLISSEELVAYSMPLTLHVWYFKLIWRQNSKTWLNVNLRVTSVTYLLGLVRSCSGQALSLPSKESRARAWVSLLRQARSLGRDQSSLCDTPLSVHPSVRPSVNNYCYRISSEAIYHRDFFIVHVCWPYGVVVHLRL